MAHKLLVAALSIAAAAPALATHPEHGPATAPAGTEVTKYCLRAGPVTGTRLDTVLCLTREEWAEAEVDVDKEWAENGVRVIA